MEKKEREELEKEIGDKVNEIVNPLTAEVETLKTEIAAMKSESKKSSPESEKHEGHHSVFDHACEKCKEGLKTFLSHLNDCQEGCRDALKEAGFVLEGEMNKPKIEEELCASCTEKAMKAGIQVTKPQEKKSHVARTLEVLRFR